MVAFWFGPTIPRYVMDRLPLIQPHPRTHQIICSNLKQNRHDITSGNKRRWTCYHQQRHVRREELANDVTQWNDDSASLRGCKLFFDILCCSKLGIRMEIKATEIGLFGPLTLTESPERVLQGNMFNQIWRIKGSIGRFIIFQTIMPKTITVSWNFQTPIKNSKWEPGRKPHTVVYPKTAPQPNIEFFEPCDSA